MTEGAASILYLHGFRSSSASAKVTCFREWLAQHLPPVVLVAPDLPPSPDASIQLAMQLLADSSKKWLGVVGSSLGGYYAAYLSEHSGLPAALINPAAYPYRLFQDYLGEHQNLYTGEVFELKASYLDELRALDVLQPRHPARLLLLLQTGDETLDYREALEKYPHSPAWIKPGGRHEYSDFNMALPAILGFMGCAPDL
ncbi:MAG: esterase [Hahellaceae bacterium]|nr:esterase [Hahellaceae bacterium]